MWYKVKTVRLYHKDIHWKIWGSNPVISYRAISSPKHPDLLQHPHSLQPNQTQSVFLASTMTRAGSMTTHICLQPTLEIGGATPPLHLYILGQIHFTLTSNLRTYPSTGHILSGLIKEPFYTSFTPYMHTTWHNYFIFFDPITLTLWTVPVTNLIVQGKVIK
jgi:hypothetical protein